MRQFAYYEFKTLEKEDLQRAICGSEESLSEVIELCRVISAKFERLLKIKSRVEVEPPPADQVPLPMEQELKEIKESMKVRKAAKDNLLICATVKSNGGCTKAFNHKDELAAHIYERSGAQWRHSIILIC